MANPSRYEFVTQWTIPAPIERVWKELLFPEQWPDWWRGVESVELVRPGVAPLGTGAIRRYVWKSRLPYRLKFTMETTFIEPLSRIEGHATGELEGFGCWQLSHADGNTQVRYDWHVIANKWWMRWLAPLARPAFEWNHDIVMEWGRQGLIRRVAGTS
jgi:uncharacterized protein YndB with AHSA1/START domain